MENLLAQLDTLLKPINDAMKNLNRAKLIRNVAIYLLIAGIFSACGAILLFVGGAAAAVGGAISNSATSDLGRNSAEMQAALRGLGVASGIAIFYGVLSLISAPLLIVGAVGLFQRHNWGRMVAVLAFLVNAAISLLGLITGTGGFFSLIWVLGGAYLAYFFYRDEGIKAEFNKA
jgi:hypothetical protein